MTRDQLMVRLDEIMNRAPGTTKPGQSLEGADDWDSLAMLGLIALADEDLSIRLTGNQLRGAKSVDDIVAMLASKLEG